MHTATGGGRPRKLQLLISVVFVFAFSCIRSKGNVKVTERFVKFGDKAMNDHAAPGRTTGGQRYSLFACIIVLSCAKQEPSLVG